MKVAKFGLYLCLLLPGVVSGTQIYRCEGPWDSPQFQQLPCDGPGEVVPLSEPAGRWAPLRPSEQQWLKQHKRPLIQHHKAPRVRDPQAKERRCWAKRKRVEALSARLRRGYKRAQGERWRRQRNNLDEYLRRYCD